MFSGMTDQFPFVSLDFVAARRQQVTTTAAARVVTMTAFLIIATSCLRSSIPVEYQTEPIPQVIGCAVEPCASGDETKVTYLGVSGFLIESRGRALLTGPSFTNPSLDSVTPTRYRFLRGRAPTIRPDKALIDRLLPPAADKASMILVGHGHYDHLLDVPHVANAHARDAQIYGGPTVRHMLMGDSALRANASRVIGISGDDVGRVDRVGRWFTSTDRAFRVMALEADHARTVNLFRRRGMLFAAGTLDGDLTELPRRAEDWKLGEPYSYLIDVLGPDGATPVFRIYYQDAPNTAPLGFPPASLGGRRVDLAILCVATARNVDPPSPDSLLKVLRPKYVIAAHWESFFRPQTLPIYLNPVSDVDKFNVSLMKSMPADGKWAMPLPRTTLRFAPQL
jgi:L-ascorbate metabolism protein UlaG (beta-lactamase superfamily)